jgi:DNA-binding NtrC family response regulator
LVRAFLATHYDLDKGNFITPEALQLLMNYDYPGNIRELKAMVESAVNLAQGLPIAPRFLPRTLSSTKPAKKVKLPDGAASLAPLAEVEQTHIMQVYQQLNHNKSQAARILGIGLNTLRRKLAGYGEK